MRTSYLTLANQKGKIAELKSWIKYGVVLPQFILTESASRIQTEIKRKKEIKKTERKIERGNGERERMKERYIK